MPGGPYLPPLWLITTQASARPLLFRAGVSCVLMTRDAETARRDAAAKDALPGPPVPRPAGEGPELPLPTAAHDPVSYTYTTDLAVIRAIVHRYAVMAGLTEARAIDLVLAVSEVAANTVRHAKSPGTLQRVHLFDRYEFLLIPD